MKRREPADPATPYLEKLREGKVKVTPNRRKVLGHFLAEDRPWTLLSLHRSLSASARCDLSSVFRTLEALRDSGLLEEYRLPGEKQTYFSLIKPGRAHGERGTPSGHHHHHIVCQGCGRVSHLDMCLPQGWMGKAEGRSGFRITEHNLEFKGWCSRCR